jgi:hypothetical protein
MRLRSRSTASWTEIIERGREADDEKEELPRIMESSRDTDSQTILPDLDERFQTGGPVLPSFGGESGIEVGKPLTDEEMVHERIAGDEFSQEEIDEEEASVASFRTAAEEEQALVDFNTDDDDDTLPMNDPMLTEAARQESQAGGVNVTAGGVNITAGGVNSALDNKEEELVVSSPESTEGSRNSPKSVWDLILDRLPGIPVITPALTFGRMFGGRQGKTLLPEKPTEQPPAELFDTTDRVDSQGSTLPEEAMLPFEKQIGRAHV